MIKSVINYWLKIFFTHRVAKLVRAIGVPPVRIRKKLRFVGHFSRNVAGQPVNFFNSRFLLESEVFWLGLDNMEWEQTSRTVWAQLAKNSRRALDIGANTGLYSIIAKISNRDIQIDAFEPQPNIFEVLSKHSELNQFNFKCNPFALSSSVGEASFYNYGDEAFTGNTSAGSLNKDWRTEGQSAIMVELQTLDSYLENSPSKVPVDLVKIDVETHEVEVLSGGKSTLAKHRPILLIEILNQEVFEGIKNILSDLSYKFYRIIEGDGIYEKFDLDFGIDNLNFLVIPEEKREQLKDFAIKRA